MRTVNRLTQLNLSERLGRLNHCYLVGCLILLGLLLRLPFLRLGLFRDEGSTYFDALPTTPGEVVRTVILCELNPPGFFLIMHQWMRWFGSQEIIFKLPALIFGLLLIAATYGLGRVVGSRTTALLAVLFATLAPAAVYYSQEARPYTLSALLSCLSVLLYCQALRSKRQIPYLLGFVVCAGLLVYVHYTGLLLVGSLAAVTSLFWLRRTELHIRIVPFIFAFGGIFLLFLPWLPTFLIHLSTEVPWEDKSPLWKLPYQLVDHLSYTIPLVGFLQKPLSFVVVLILGVRIGQFFYRTGKVTRFQNAPYNLPIVTLEASLGLLTILEAVLVSNGRRYMFIFFPLAWVVYSYWLLVLFKYLDSHWQSRSDNRQLQLALKLFFVLVLLGGFVFPNAISALYRGYHAQHHPKSGMRPLIADVKKMNWEKTVFLVAPNPLAPSFGYYSAQMQISAPLYGFPVWDHPELFIVQDYVQRLKAPAAVTAAEQRIREQARQGYRQLALVTFAGEKDSQTEQLLAKLKLKYPMLLTKDYSGAEPVTLHLFSWASTQ